MVALACLIGGAFAAEGDLAIATPAASDFAIDEPDSQIFTLTITNTDPTNQTFNVTWYQDSVLQQTTMNTNATSDTWTFEGSAATAGVYNITAFSNNSDTANWTMTVNNKIFAGITEVVSATVGILPDIASIVIGVIPVLVTLMVVGLITQLPSELQEPV